MPVGVTRPGPFALENFNIDLIQCPNKKVFRSIYIISPGCTRPSNSLFSSHRSVNSLDFCSSLFFPVSSLHSRFPDFQLQSFSLWPFSFHLFLSTMIYEQPTVSYNQSQIVQIIILHQRNFSISLEPDCFPKIFSPKKLKLQRSYTYKINEQSGIFLR